MDGKLNGTFNSISGLSGRSQSPISRVARSTKSRSLSATTRLKATIVYFRKKKCYQPDAVVIGPRLLLGARIRVKAWGAVILTDRGITDEKLICSFTPGRATIRGRDHRLGSEGWLSLRR